MVERAAAIARIRAHDLRAEQRLRDPERQQRSHELRANERSDIDRSDTGEGIGQ
jgi:hypothetical protein